MQIPNNIVHFAVGNPTLYNKMIPDWWNHYKSLQDKTRSYEFAKSNDKGELITFEEKEKQITDSIIKEAMKRTNVPYLAEAPADQIFNHQGLRNEIFAVVASIVDMIIPQTLIDSISLYSDVRTIGFGDSAQFDVESNDLFSVSQIGRGQRNSFAYKQFMGTKTVIPVNHALTVYADLYRVLAGKESLAKLVTKVIRSMETAMRNDVYDAFAAMAAALPTTATTGLQVAGYSQDSLMRLCEQVTAWNNGNKAMIVGTARALVNVLPNDANYRYTLDDPYMTLGHVRTAFGYDVMELPQVANHDTEWALKIDTDRLWILSPASQKFVKLVLEGSTLSITDSVYENRNLIQRATMHKSWGTGVSSNSVMAVLTI